VSLAPTQSVVSALTPSITWFQLPSGYQLSVTLDPAAIAALQAALPNVAQVLIVFDPAPSLLNDVQRGSLGGGNVTPAGLPFALTLVPKDSDGKTVTPVTLPAVAARTPTPKP